MEPDRRITGDVSMTRQDFDIGDNRHFQNSLFDTVRPMSSHLSTSIDIRGSGLLLQASSEVMTRSRVIGRSLLLK